MKIVDLQVIPFGVHRTEFRNGELQPDVEVVQTLTKVLTDEGAEGYYLGGRGHGDRDGILAGLYFLDLMVKTGKSPSELIDYLYSKVGPHYYQRLDVEFPEKQRTAIIRRLTGGPPPSIDGVKVVKSDNVDGFRFTLADNTWLLVRFSGTEPLLRIYTESDSPDRVEILLEVGKELAGV